MHKWESISLNDFNGPLDLLLHMIKDKQVDIMEVNLIDISNQYVDYIYSFELLDIEIASEYLEMAAYLIELKSKLLIPKEIVEIDINIEERQQDELLRRLVEYHKIKEVSEYFKEKQIEYLQTYSKSKSIVKIIKVDDDKLPLAKNTVDIDKFANVFLKILERNKINDIQVNTINYVEISPEEVSNEIQHLINTSNKQEWFLEELIEISKRNKQMLIATFLAILDLAKNQIINIFQSNENIIIKKFKEGIINE